MVHKTSQRETNLKHEAIVHLNCLQNHDNKRVITQACPKIPRNFVNEAQRFKSKGKGRVF